MLARCVAPSLSAPFRKCARPQASPTNCPLRWAPAQTARFNATKTSTGNDETGHIEALSNEGIMFLDNVSPLRLGTLLRLPFVTPDVNRYVDQLVKKLGIPENAAASETAIANQAAPPSLPLKITAVLPRAEEGGAYVKFKYGADEDAKSIEQKVKENLKRRPIKPWYSLSPVRSFLVKGQPWLEDLHRLPSPLVKVEFYPGIAGKPVGELSEEALYALFRRYGRLKDIKPQATDSKEVPRYAHLYFDRIRPAIMAKCCMHGYTVPPEEGGASAGTVLKLTYVRKRKAGQIWEWLLNHPRVTIPLLLALLGTTATLIFDPLRTFSIKAHVTRSFHISDFRIFRWLTSQATKSIELLNLRRNHDDDSGLRAIWSDRKDSIEKLQKWLMESPETFVVVTGPRGSGKKELVLEQALKGRKNKLLIDCKVIQEARGDAAIISAAAQEVGYRPVFSWMNNMSSLIDLAAAGAIGAKTGFSETLDTQLQNIWQNTSRALRSIAVDDRTKDDKDANLGDDEYLEAHPEKRPVVIIDNFLHKSQESSLVYDRIAEWAASLTTSNIAHVIFLTNDVSFSKSLSKALPNRVFRQISLGDCSPEVAKRFVINDLDATDTPSSGSKEKSQPPSQRRTDLSTLDAVLPTLGGRLTDLEFLARRIKSGESPQIAVAEIISQSASEILKMYILDIGREDIGRDGDGASKPWTPEAAWSVIKALAATKEGDGGIKYQEFVILQDGNEGMLRALEQAELISIGSIGGRPSVIKPGKPVYTAAFRQLVGDKVLKARMDLASLEAAAKKEAGDIAKAEGELQVLGSLPGKPAETARRAMYLLQKINKAQVKIEDLERMVAECKSVVAQDL